MNNIKYLVVFFVIISCSLNGSEDITKNYFDVIVEKSPWTLDHVEILEIKGVNGYVFNQSEIEKIAGALKNSNDGTIEFYDDGKGLWNSLLQCQNCPITWNEIPKEKRISWIYQDEASYFNIRTSNQVIELIWNKSNDNFIIIRPDGTIRGDYLNCNYVWK
ncbi:hypothetical protein WJN01_03645 [Flavobacteriaceae bacterium SZ-1-7]|uniref:hypothetical protein n=1 Tax=Tamlana sedimenti TaxID=3134126 RepID=UPI003129BA71